MHINFLIDGISNEFLKKAFDLDRDDIFKAIGVRYFAIGADTIQRGYIGDRLQRMKHGDSFSELIKGDFATKITAETLEYFFANSKESPKCYKYLLSFEEPQKEQYGRYNIPITFIEPLLVDYSIKYKDFAAFNCLYDYYKMFLNLCNYRTENGQFYDVHSTYVTYSTYGGSSAVGRLFEFSESQVKSLILAKQHDLAKKCIEYNKMIIAKKKDIDRYHADGNHGVFLMSDIEIDRFFKLNSDVLSTDEKKTLECVDNWIIKSSKIIQLRDLASARKIIDSNYYCYYEFAYDAVANGKAKEFFKFLIDNELESLAKNLMMGESSDPGHKEFLKAAWNLFADLRNTKYEKVIKNQNKMFDDPKDGRNVSYYYNAFVWSLIGGGKYYSESSHETRNAIEGAITALENNAIINFIKGKKEEIYNEAKSLIDSEKKAEQEKIERAKAVKGLSKNYFNDLLNNGGNELFIIKLCALLDAIFKFDYHYEGEEFVDRMNAHFRKLEENAPKSRDCDDGWGYMVLDQEYEDKVVKPEQEKIKHLRDIFYRLRVQRNNIAHSESNKVQELSSAELKETLEYVFSINKVEE